MTTLIEIVCSISQEEAARTTIEAFCKETSGLLIGRDVNEETHQVLLMVQLPQAASASMYATSPSPILQKQVITSFRYITCDLVKISFDPLVDLQELMRDFPLRPGELWFTAIQNPHQVYVCLSRPFMLTEQAAWLLGHEVQWAYV